MLRCGVHNKKILCKQTAMVWQHLFTDLKSDKPYILYCSSFRVDAKVELLGLTICTVVNTGVFPLLTLTLVSQTSNFLEYFFELFLYTATYSKLSDKR